MLTRGVDGQLRVDCLDLAVFFRDESERVGAFIDSLSISGEVVARNPAPGRQTGYGNESPVLKLDYRVGAYALPTFPSFPETPEVMTSTTSRRSPLRIPSPASVESIEIIP